MDTSDMAKQHGKRRRSLPGILIALAGACGILSYALGWARMTYPTSEPSLATAPAGHPRLGLFLGLFMIVAGVVIVVSGSREASRAWGTFGVACGLVMGAVAVRDLVHEHDR